VACQEDIKQKPITTKTLEEVKDSKELTEKDKELVAAYLIRTGIKKALLGEDPMAAIDSNLTVADAIEKQRQWILEDSIRSAEEKRLAEEALRKREAELAKLRGMVIVSLLKKEFMEYTYEQYVTITIAIANNSDKAIQGVKGALRLEDMFGDPIITLQIKHDQKVSAGKRIITKASYEYNQFSDSDKEFRFTPLEKITAKWEPEVIIFADGTRFESGNY